MKKVNEVIDLIKGTIEEEQSCLTGAPCIGLFTIIATPYGMQLVVNKCGENDAQKLAASAIHKSIERFLKQNNLLLTALCAISDDTPEEEKEAFAKVLDEEIEKDKTDKIESILARLFKEKEEA